MVNSVGGNKQRWMAVKVANVKNYAITFFAKHAALITFQGGRGQVQVLSWHTCICPHQRLDFLELPSVVITNSTHGDITMKMISGDVNDSKTALK